MAILEFLLTPYSIPVAVALYYLVPYLTQNTSLRDIPAPTGAQFSSLWLLLQARLGIRYMSVHEAHKRLGKFVRIEPDHVSIADVGALQAIYGHGNGFLKSDFYDAFVSIRRGLFNTRDRAEHTRKRKIVAHIFSAKSIGQFEPHMQTNLTEFIKQWDKACAAPSLAKAQQGYAELDSLDWFNYLAFDIIGDLAFGAPFGMVTSGADVAEIRRNKNDPPTYAPAVEIINRRGEVSGTLGVMPYLKPYAKYFPDPFFSKGSAAVENLAGIAIARVTARMEAQERGDETRHDLLARLMEGKDDQGKPLGREELTAEALTQLIAGSDTTSNTSCAIMFWAVKTPGVIEKLRQELDAAIPADVDIPTYEMVKGLPYMQSVINESLRVHSTASIGLPRIIPPGPGITIDGHHFPAGTVLSVPSYTIHHSEEIWGKDADEFRPERWECVTQRQKDAFVPFSYGPRSCVGRNVAEMELALILATWARRYDVILYEDELKTREGFLRKPLHCRVGIRRRV